LSIGKLNKISRVLILKFMQSDSLTSVEVCAILVLSRDREV